jgi:hypothetical protein
MSLTLMWGSQLLKSRIREPWPLWLDLISSWTWDHLRSSRLKVRIWSCLCSNAMLNSFPICLLYLCPDCIYLFPLTVVL